MTNIRNLPMIDGANTLFAIAFDSDWADQIYVSQPGFSGVPVNLTGATTASSATATGLTSTVGIAAGSLVQCAAFPAGTTVLSTTATSATLSANATQTLADVSLWFFAPPLDLTGITFRCQLRASVGSPNVLLDASTTNGLMTNAETSGLFGFNIPAATLRASPLLALVQASQGQADFVADIRVTDATGAFANLCPDAPFTVQARLGVTQ